MYDEVRLSGQGERACIEAAVEPRANSKAQCSICERRCPGYDHLAVRRFEFIPLWAIAVFFVYAPRRVECPEHGVVVEFMP